MIYGIRVKLVDELYIWLTLGFRYYLYEAYDPTSPHRNKMMGFKQRIQDTPLQCVIDDEHVVSENRVHYFEVNTPQEYYEINDALISWVSDDASLRYQLVKRNLFNYHLQGLSEFNYGNAENLFTCILDPCELGDHIVIGISLFERLGSAFDIESQCKYPFFNSETSCCEALHPDFIADLIKPPVNLPPPIHSHISRCFNEFLDRSLMIDPQGIHTAKYYALYGQDEAEVYVDDSDASNAS